MEWLLTVINILTLSYMLYYVITSIPTFFKQKKLSPSYPKAKFGILIAARNEENVIGYLLDSLNAQNYPKHLYDIYVIPNNCDDNTEQVSISKWARIIHPEGNIFTKGDAIKYAFRYLKQNNVNHDAYIIFDADNMVKSNFLKIANNAYCSGIKVAQGYRDSKNPNDSWISGGFSIYHWMQNIFINGSRQNLNASSYISGTGFMIAKEVIDKYGYNVNTIAEDTELTIQCALNGIKIAYLKEAVFYDEQAVDFKTSVKQRKRWSYGTLQCLKKYNTQLLKKEGFQCFDMYMFMLASIVQLTTVISQLLFNVTIKDSLVFNVLSIILTSYVCTIFGGIMVVILSKKKVKLNILLLFPLFIFSWLPINIYVLFKKECKWEQIRHERVLSLEEIS